MKQKQTPFGRILLLYENTGNNSGDEKRFVHKELPNTCKMAPQWAAFAEPSS